MSYISNTRQFFLRIAASGFIPATWFIKNRPEPKDLSAKTGNLNLEIVSHCWNYSSMLIYQLSSLVQYPPQKTNVTVTVFYSLEDVETSELLKKFEAVTVERVKWNFRCLAKAELMRRAIGRNLAAKSTEADWVWFTDCDVLFYEHSFDILSNKLQGKQALLVYPRTLLATHLLPSTDPMLHAGIENVADLKIDRDKFSPRQFDRATGPIQIMHGDAARLCGYCDDIKYYQQPQEQWCKCHEDRAFRWLLGTQGEAIDVPNVYLIRHVEKGRYKKNSFWSKVRIAIRKANDAK